MRAIYGDQHGFNWKVGKAIGMQLVTVPATDAIAHAHAAWWRSVAANILVLAAVFVVLNWVVSRSVIAPIERRSMRLRRLAGTDPLTGAQTGAASRTTPPICWHTAQRVPPHRRPWCSSTSTTSKASTTVTVTTAGTVC
jgi:hypothetical protein